MMPVSDDFPSELDAHPDEPARIVADDFNPRTGMANMNEIMADDDLHDPYLESYQPEEAGT